MSELFEASLLAIIRGDYVELY
ncbi:hypothetical protein LINPERPRIM_LOCUS2163 [Linum perenne]